MRVIQYAAASQLIADVSGILGRPVKPGDDVRSGGGSAGLIRIRLRSFSCGGQVELRRDVQMFLAPLGAGAAHVVLLGAVGEGAEEGAGMGDDRGQVMRERHGGLR